MRYSKFFLPTLKEEPAEAEIISHKLMVRAGCIRKLATGVYSYLPLGLRTLRKVENIIREEMNNAGAIEMLMPGVQPAEIWKESGRWTFYGKELLRFRDRHDHDCCLGPTHEEVITDIMRREIRSYRDMPVNLYHIQTKFRDEIRPRFGLMRAREFIMKDAYSFDADEAGAEKSYRAMYDAYEKIFRRCGLRFTAVEADSGTIGGSYSHEFMVLADTGEDAIVNCPACGYSANTEKAEYKAPAGEQLRDENAPAPEKVLTENRKTIEDVSNFLSVDPGELIKTLIYKTENGPLAVLVPGNRDVNEIKLDKLIEGDIELADPEYAQKATGCPVGFAGPVGLDIPVWADNGVKAVSNAIVGANEKDYHFKNVVPGRDFTINAYHDLVDVKDGDPCPKCDGRLEEARGIEVGHVFKLGTKYSKSMNATFLDAQGKEQYIIMGCYGIGPGRTMAAAVEQNHDENGIVWPMPIAPFEAVILPLQVKDEQVSQAAEDIYNQLVEMGVEVILDDRDERAGIKFKDADLTGVPIRVAIGKKTLADGKVEFKLRNGGEVQLIDAAEAPRIVKETRDRHICGL